MHATPVAYLWLIPLLPLAGAAWNGFFGKQLSARYGDRVVSLVGCASVLLSFVVSLYTFQQLLGTEPRLLEQKLWTWFSVGDLHVDFAYRVDPLTAVMLLVVTGVGSLIHIYSTGYMHGDKGYYRYFAYLNLFVWAMLTLVLGANLFMLFIGWEGVGLCSYLLIGFWFTDVQKAIAGMKAFIVNRIGDFGFVVGGFALFWALQRHGVGTVDFQELRSVVPLLAQDRIFGIHLPTFVTLCFFVGATGKSAQIPLYVWLPDAMAGPTPVSALIHAATMVTAGVYMIGRMSFLYDMAPVTLAVVATVGAITALFAATIGLVQNDIKKVLAYSTVSQLGYMFLGMGVAAYGAGIFHLMTHAFFKACLFLGAGSVIHAMHHEQDIRKMGGLKDHMPRTYWTFLISTLAIAGIVPFAGFFSKDEILWQAWSSPHGSKLLWLVGAIGALLTAFYMSRLVFLTFWGKCRADEHTKHHLHESPTSMTGVLIVLAALAVVGGWVGIPNALIPGGNRFEHFLSPVFETAAVHEGTMTETMQTLGAPGHEAAAAPAEEGTPAVATETAPGETAGATHAASEAAPSAHAGAGEAHGGPIEYVLMLVSLAIACTGIGLAHQFYVRRPAIPGALVARFQGVYQLLLNKYWVDELYEATVLAGAKGLARLLARFDLRIVDGMVNGVAWLTRLASWFGGAIDRYLVDGAVNGVAWIVRSAGGQARRVQTGVVQNYVLAVFVGVAAIIVLMRLL